MTNELKRSSWPCGVENSCGFLGELVLAVGDCSARLRGGNVKRWCLFSDAMIGVDASRTVCCLDCFTWASRESLGHGLCQLLLYLRGQGVQIMLCYGLVVSRVSSPYELAIGDQHALRQSCMDVSCLDIACRTWVECRRVAGRLSVCGWVIGRDGHRLSGDHFDPVCADTMKSKSAKRHSRSIFLSITHCGV